MGDIISHCPYSIAVHSWQLALHHPGGVEALDKVQQLSCSALFLLFCDQLRLRDDPAPGGGCIPCSSCNGIDVLESLRITLVTIKKGGERGGEFRGVGGGEGEYEDLSKNGMHAVFANA